jgi:protein gp37
MGERTAISWTDHTFNPWWGCVRVSPGCAHCYAAAFSKRILGMDLWKPGAARRSFGQKHWNEPLKWNEQAKADGRQHRVFCASMADVFEVVPMVDGADTRSYIMENERARLWDLISATPYLDWQLLTKRPEKIRNLIRPLWKTAPNTNVWLGTSVENRATLHRIIELRHSKAVVRFLSLEPLIEDLGELDLDGIQWVIVGGESGPKARPCAIGWLRDIVRQCKAAGVSVFVKQLGSRPTNREGEPHPLRHRKGEDPAEWPEDLRVQEFPQ